MKLRLARRAGGPLPSVAAVTMVRDEGRMLPKWIDHYGAQLGLDNLVVVDDSSEDGSTDDLPCSVLRLPPAYKKDFEPTRMGVLSGLAATLLEVHDAVLFSDADEFVVADPAKHESLRHFVAARRDREAVGVLGLNVIHHLAAEGPLDFGRPFLEQRRLAKFVPLMCKPALKTVPAPWAAASHGIRTDFAIDPELYMFHFKFADRDHLRAAAEHRKAMVEMDGRAAVTSWSQGGDALVDLLEEMNADLSADPGDQAEFRPPPRKRLGEIVERTPQGVVRATGVRQMLAMQRRPALRIPERFRSTV